MHGIIYEADKYHNAEYDDGSTSSFILKFHFMSPMVEILEEIPEISFPDFAGSVGGSLGLFIVTLKASWWGFNENKSRLIESSEENIFISPNKRIEWAKRTSEIMAKYKYFTNEWDQKGFIFIKPEPGGF